MKIKFTVFAPLALVILVGCGGGSTETAPSAPQPASSLAYIDPMPATGEWALVKDASSTPNHLVLNLKGPSDGTLWRGIGFTLKADPTKVRFGLLPIGNGNPRNGYYRDTGLFLDKTPDLGLDKPVSLQMGGVREGKLMVGLFQKTDEKLFGYQGATAKDCSGVVTSISIDLDVSLQAMPGEVSLALLKARAIPEVIDDLYFNRKMVTVPIKVGTLTLK